MINRNKVIEFAKNKLDKDSYYADSNGSIYVRVNYYDKYVSHLDFSEPFPRYMIFHKDHFKNVENEHQIYSDEILHVRKINVPELIEYTKHMSADVIAELSKRKPVVDINVRVDDDVHVDEGDGSKNIFMMFNNIIYLIDRDSYKDKDGSDTGWIYDTGLITEYHLSDNTIVQSDMSYDSFFFCMVRDVNIKTLRGHIVTEDDLTIKRISKKTFNKFCSDMISEYKLNAMKKRYAGYDDVINCVNTYHQMVNHLFEIRGIKKIEKLDTPEKFLVFSKMIPSYSFIAEYNLTPIEYTDEFTLYLYIYYAGLN